MVGTRIDCPNIRPPKLGYAIVRNLDKYGIVVEWFPVNDGEKNWSFHEAVGMVREGLWILHPPISAILKEYYEVSSRD
jgi:hypothetical protein